MLVGNQSKQAYDCKLKAMKMTKFANLCKRSIITKVTENDFEDMSVFVAMKPRM